MRSRSGPCVALLLGLAGCAWGPPELTIPDDYHEQGHFKALARTRNVTGAWAYGYAYNYDDPEQAVARAVTQCEGSAEVRFVYSSCRLYLLGDEVVWGQSISERRRSISDYHAEHAERQCFRHSEVAAYLQDIRKLVRESWVAPPESPSVDRVTIELQLSATGELEQIQSVLLPRQLAQSVLAALGGAAPFAPPPKCLVGVPLRATFSVDELRE
jgi:hypothetical protein